MYQFLLSIHLIAIISWMAGLLYLLRLFVYHRIETEEVVRTRFVTMEDRLYRIITTPAMVVSLIAGIAMLWIHPALLSQPWMHVKLTAVVAMIGLTHYAKRLKRQLAAGTATRGEKFYRILNEIPTLLMILIVFMVIMRPF